MQAFRLAIGSFTASILVLWLIAVLMQAQAAPLPTQQSQVRDPQATQPVTQPATAETPPAAETRADTSEQPPTTYERHITERDDNNAAPTQPAQTEPEASEIEPSASAFSVQLSLDAANQYFYHGIIQEDTGLILQPAARLTVNLHEKDDFKVEALVGAWNSVHSQETGAGTDGITDAWYELDLIAGVVFTKDSLSLATTYTFLTSPNDAFETVQELGFTAAYDDRNLLGKIALHPYAMLSIETGANGSDGADSDHGTYFELGIAPGFSFDIGKTPVSLTFPVSVGLSLNDYYQNADGEDDLFGFAQFGVKASVPLPFGDRYGQWTLNASVAALYLGDHTAEFNRGHNLEFIATLGVQLNF